MFKTVLIKYANTSSTDSDRMTSTVKLLIEAPASIRTSNLDPRLVLETRLL